KHFLQGAEQDDGQRQLVHDTAPLFVVRTETQWERGGTLCRSSECEGYAIIRVELCKCFRIHGSLRKQVWESATPTSRRETFMHPDRQSMRPKRQQGFLHHACIQ